jgi:hypothetical protein
MDYYTLHYITFLGNHYVGKSTIIKNITSGKHLHPLLPTINKDTTLINTNNKFYKYKMTPWSVFKPYKNIKRIAYIVVNTSIADSVNSIPFWYNKIHNNKMDNIFIILINKNKDTPTNLNILHNVIQFCTLHKIKLININ